MLLALGFAIVLTDGRSWVRPGSIVDFRTNLNSNQPQYEPTVPTTTSPVFAPEPVQAIPKIPELVLLDVPFTSQAPLGHWDDPRQENGCEEAAVLMAMAWVRGEELEPAVAEKDIIAIADFELKTYGSYLDTSAEDTVTWIFEGFYGYSKAIVEKNINMMDIKDELATGNLVIVPVNGQKLHNPHYKQPGPLTHMLVIIGYDDKTREFVTNDSGTKFGKGYRYSYSILENATYDYATGFHEPQIGEEKAMIVVSR